MDTPYPPSEHVKDMDEAQRQIETIMRHFDLVGAVFLISKDAGGRHMYVLDTPWSCVQPSKELFEVKIAADDKSRPEKLTALFCWLSIMIRLADHTVKNFYAVMAELQLKFAQDLEKIENEEPG